MKFEKLDTDYICGAVSFIFMCEQFFLACFELIQNSIEMQRNLDEEKNTAMAKLWCNVNVCL